MLYSRIACTLFTENVLKALELLAIYPRTILLSNRKCSVNSSISNSFLQVHLLRKKTAEKGSNPRAETNFRGVTLALTISQVPFICPHLSTSLS